MNRMIKKRKPSNNFQKIDPDDYENYQEQFVDKGGGGRTSAQKGKKTIHALKKQQRDQSVEQRRKVVEDSLKQVLRNFPISNNSDIHEKNMIRYSDWIKENIDEMAAPDPSECMITFTKSGGPGGQNVNKRETKVLIIHRPTNIRVENDQTRSQMQNKNLALENLRGRLQNHLSAWREYLNPGQSVDVELVKLLID